MSRKGKVGRGIRKKAFQEHLCTKGGDIKGAAAGGGNALE